MEIVITLALAKIELEVIRLVDLPKGKKKFIIIIKIRNY